MSQHTPLYTCHLQHKGCLVDFCGWQLPLHYGSQLQEHHAVRAGAGVFDVSHMTIVDLTGSDARAYLRYLLANDVARLATTGKALYSCMLNHEGGILDDLIVYYLSETHYRVVFNAATRAVVLPWLERHVASFDVQRQVCDELALLAVQGPKARELTQSVLPSHVAIAAQGLGRFACVSVEDWFIARTGYTGEDGFEIALPAAQAASFWDALTQVGVTPCGLGARDTLRLEAGLNLYGQDMDSEISPWAGNLGWTVAMSPTDRAFLGREALEAQQASGCRATISRFGFADGRCVTTRTDCVAK